MILQRSSAWWHTLAWLVICSVFTCSKAARCAPPPIAVPFGNVTLSSNNIRRGVEVSVGTPPQQFAFMPAWSASRTVNNTYLYGTDGHCGGWEPGFTRVGCTTLRGGAYDSSKSESPKTPPRDSYPSDPAPFNQMEYVAETLKLNSDTSVLDFPMGVATDDLGKQAYYPQMTLGLGSNSTLLNALKASGKIASRTFSFFAGRFGRIPSGHVDGAVAFGGYDKAKVTGRGHTFPFSRGSVGCESDMVVSISDIELNFPDGTDMSLFEGSRSQSITTCISPSLPVFMNMPLRPYVEKMLALSNESLTIFDLQRSTGLNFWNLRYLPGYTPYNGDMTIKFVSGLSVRVPNDLLVVPETDIDRSTGVIKTDPSGPNLLINSMQDINSNDMAALGTTFLSAAYLMVNQDTDRFTLWAANPTTESDLVAVDETGADVTATTCTASASATPSSRGGSGGDGDGGEGTSDSGGGSSESASPNAPSPQEGSSVPAALPTGLIAGVAVGAVVAGGLIAAAVFWLLRRRKKKAAAAAAAATAASATDGSWNSGDQDEKIAYVPVNEAPGDVLGHVQHEVHGNSFSAEMPASAVRLHQHSFSAEMPASPAPLHHTPGARSPPEWHELA
ncbi:aspartic peptidase domain-containing protein [Chaetomium fimeti]|uniref:Aspartic peptidase domain-containing protein n=1 Tax=Chaetomium fimeti TaxID=1854472 RepID=A0AAE0LNM9_9PEZI|nr:aspartic peptidase domain-containing protein [Chaetomium fimeti]